MRHQNGKVSQIKICSTSSSEPTPGRAISGISSGQLELPEQCGAHGYVNIKPSVSIRPGKILSACSHTLRADLQFEELTVSADGAVVWRGISAQEKH
jgi:hypothetical protein